MLRILGFILSLNFGLFAIETKTIVYKDGATELEGYIAMPNNKVANKVIEKKPAILLIHEWTGLGEYIQKRADMFAELGYVVFAMDMYGKGIRAKDHTEAAALMNKYLKQPKVMLQRMNVSLDFLNKMAIVDTNRIAVVGYCFGGGAALQLAYSGADIKGVVTFHGMLKAPTNVELKHIKASFSIHHGGDDTFIAKEIISDLDEKFKNGKINFEFFSYPNAQHGFTRWLTPEMYNKSADTKSWKQTNLFLTKIFKN